MTGVSLVAVLTTACGGPQYGGNTDNDSGTSTGTSTGSIPEAPSNVQVMSAYQGILLRWDAVSNAQSYEVCYATEAIETYNNCVNYADGVRTFTNSGTSLLIESLVAAQPYYVRVVAQSGLGVVGAASDNLVVTPSLGLNDTGVTVCRESGVLNVSCPSTLFPNQDADHGRDANISSASQQSDGYAGFSMTRLDATGDAVGDDATQWSCVKDKVSGLMWEVKQRSNATQVGNDGLHDADDTYMWFNVDASSNAGTQGSENGSANTCYGYDAADSTSYCNSQAFVSRVNAEKHCGVSNWRLPTRQELNSIINYNERQPAIDLALFPNTISAHYWSNTSAFTSTASGSQVWASDFIDGGSARLDKTQSHSIRLVSDGE